MPNTLAQNAQIINEAVADIKDEIALKGVTVPDPCPITTIPSLIESISGGGGGQDTQQLINMIERPTNTSVSIPNGTTKIAGNAFYYFENLISVSVPNSVQVIEGYAFFMCTRLASINIPQGVPAINTSTFYGCGFTSITIPDSVMEIGLGAFNGTRLTTIKIPSSVNRIRSGAFADCTSLAEVDLTEYLDPMDIPTLDSISAFGSNMPGRIFKVANAEMKAAFSAATNWSTYASAFITAEEAAQNA